MKQEYKMSEEQLRIIMAACAPTPVMFLSGGQQMFSTPQENANHAWELLGDELGFKHMTVEPIGKGDQFFKAEPKDISDDVIHADKITWMQNYAGRTGVILKLDGEVGFGRTCVGIVINDTYLDYDWLDNDVWTPDDAYHKHACVAVLGHGEDAESQLYDWLKWFDINNFVAESGSVEGVTDPLRVMLGQHQYHRMVRGE